MKVISFFLLMVSLLLFSESYAACKFVIVIASYNNEEYASENILSALNQDYDEYRVIYVNDCSSDNTLKIVRDEVLNHPNGHRVSIIDNKTRNLAFKNYVQVIRNLTSDEEIIVTLDGDDFLNGSGVLSYLNEVYSGGDIWLTYGQFAFWTSNAIGYGKPYNKRIIRKSAFREQQSLPSHLRTFYSWLFKRIHEEDLKYRGEYYKMTWDVAMMLPMLEMARDHFKYVSKVLYIYNDKNPINDHKIDHKYQLSINKQIRSKRRYKRLFHKPKERCLDPTCILCISNLSQQIYMKPKR